MTMRQMLRGARGEDMPGVCRWCRKPFNRLHVAAHERVCLLREASRCRQSAEKETR